jgi:O-acetyl-ADP-ribose deacetylase (regulator of RNase III)
VTAGTEPELLASCYRECLRLAVTHDIASIAFPAISCGIYGYSVAPAARIALRTTAMVLGQAPSIRRAVFVCFSNDILRAHQAALADLVASPELRQDGAPSR